VSKGNAEQPSAQTPKGPTSPNRLETVVQARQEPGVQNRSQSGPPQNRPQPGQPGQPGNQQPRSPQGPVKGDAKLGSPGGGSPQPRPQQPNAERKPDVKAPSPQNPAISTSDRKPSAGPGAGATGKPPGEQHKGSNGQSSREEQLTTTRTGAAAVGRGSGEQQTPVRPQPPSGPRPSGPPSSASPQSNQAPTQQSVTQQTQQAKQQPQAKAPGQAANPRSQTEPEPTAPSSAAAPSAPAARTEAPSAVPVWDPPPPAQPKQPLLARLGFGKKADRSDSDVADPGVQQAPGIQQAPGVQQAAAQQAPSAQPVPTQAETPHGQTAPRPGVTGSGAAGAAAATAAAQTRARQQAPVQPGTTQPPARTEEITGPTPRVPGVAQPTAAPPAPGPQARVPAPPPSGPQARVPAPPPSGVPAPFPMPAPVQALKDAATQTNPAIPAVPDAAAPDAQQAAKSKVGVARRTRKARLRLSRFDPWSVMKTSFLFSIAAGIMLVAAVYSIWTVLSTSQLFDSLNEIVRSVVSTPGDTTPFRVQEYINTQKVMGVTALIACVDVVIFTALATLGSFLYNLAATMLGGLEITLAED
jgi:transmembrane protein DUF3566